MWEHHMVPGSAIWFLGALGSADTNSGAQGSTYMVLPRLPKASQRTYGAPACSRTLAVFVEEGEGEGGEGGEDDGLGSGSDAEGGAVGAVRISGKAGKPARKPQTKGHKGRPAGSVNYTKEHEWALVKGVQKCLPRSEHGWRQVAKYVNRHVPKEHQRAWDVYKAKYHRPTGHGEGSKLHDAVLQAEDACIAQEEVGDIDDESWSDLDAPVENAPNVPQLVPNQAQVHPEPLPAPAPAPFGRSKSAQPKSTLKAQEPDIIVLSSSDDDDAPIPPQTTPAKHKASSSVKAKPGVKAEPGVTTYYAAKAPQVAKVKAPLNKCHKNAQAMIERIHNTLSNDSNSAGADITGVTKVEIFGRDRNIECLEHELMLTRDRCHQLERQADSVAMVMTMYGVPVPAQASNGTEFPAVVPPAAAIAVLSGPPIPVPFIQSTTGHIIAPTPATPTTNTPIPDDCDDSNHASDFPIDPTLCEEAEDIPPPPVVASGSDLSAAEKGKLPVYPGN
ncbi:hypothetical protein FRC11_007841 [Ceratobasidium sp. 423]|nr:hypothetical protein FRC11_007841 [Ceratobasidium sp. 423]